MVSILLSVIRIDPNETNKQPFARSDRRIQTPPATKTENEINPVKLRPHPHEFSLYYDI